MADALAFIGVVGVAGQIIQLIARHGLDWKDAPAETAKCLEDINLLKAMLEDTDTDVLMTLSTEWRAATAASVSACKDELARLYRELTRRTVGHRVGWRRLKGAFTAKKTREAVEDLHRRFQAINGSVSRDALVVVTRGVAELREAKQQTILDQDAERVVDWISPAEYDSVHSDFISRRQEGTGKWLLESDEYSQWLDGTGKGLYCPGIPGAGKTMAAAIVADDLLGRFRESSDVGIAFIYCNFRRQGDQKPEDILASLLKQLCKVRAPLPKCVRDLFDECKARKRRPRLDELAAALKEVIPQFSQVFLVMDALDEFGLEDGSRSKLLAEYTSLRHLAGANIFATSRHIDDIKQKFVGSLSLEILAQPEDIRRYLDDKIPHLASFVADNIQLREEIKEAIVDAVEGMFLLAKLHLDSLQGQRSPRQIRLLLSKFRKGSDAYYHAYEDAMGRIRGQLKGLEDLAMQALAWIVCAKRPLKPAELQEALAIELNSDEVDPDNRSRIEDIVSACAGLVTVDEQDQVVRLVHYTAQEYFGSTMAKWFPTAEQDITQACVTYLSSSVFNSRRLSTLETYTIDDFIDWRHNNPQHYLFDYASINWGYHARLSTSQESKDQAARRSIVRFLESSPHVFTAFKGWVEQRKYELRFHDLDDGYLKYVDFDDSELDNSDLDDDDQGKGVPAALGIHLSAIFGLDWAVSHFLRQVHPDEHDDTHHTALSWATECGWPTCVALLIEAGANVNQKITRYDRTIIWLAAAKGDGLMVKQLLHLAEEIDVSKTCRGNLWNGRQGMFTPLAIAAAHGHTSVVRILLGEERARVECSQSPDSGRGQFAANLQITPLYAAASGGYTDIVELLLDHGASTGSANESRMTPIVAAIEKDSFDVVKLLLLRQADPNDPELRDRTPIARACSRGCVEIVKVLLEAGADPNAICDGGMSVLSHAALGGNKAAVDLLLENERFHMDLDRKDEWGGTAVFWAAVSGHPVVVNTLVTHGAQGRPKTGWDLTPLHKAALETSWRLAVILLNRVAVNILLWDASGRAPQANRKSVGKYFEKVKPWKWNSTFMKGTWDIEEGRRIVEGCATDREAESDPESELSSNGLAQLNL